MMSDDKLYTCTWKKTSNGFEIRSVEFPEIVGQGATLFKAEEQFAFRLSDRVQQWPAAFGYTVPAPVDEEFAKFQSDWILVTGSNAVLKQQGGLSHLFKGGACLKCGVPKGPRTDEILSFDYSCSAIEDVVSVTSGPVCINLYSKQFADVIVNTWNPKLELRATKHSGRSEKQFFELVTSETVLPVVPKFCVGTCWQCPDCGAAVIGGRFRVGELRYFFDESEVAGSGHNYIVIGQRDSGELLVSLSKWRGVRNGEGLVGVRTHRVGLLPKSMHLGHATDFQKTKGE